MVMKVCTAFPKAPALLESHDRGVGFYPSAENSRCIQQRTVYSTENREQCIQQRTVYSTENGVFNREQCIQQRTVYSTENREQSVYSTARADGDGRIRGQSFQTINKSSFAQSAGDLPATSVQEIWHKTVWWRGPSNGGALRNKEHPFIAIAPRSTLARRSSNC